MNQPPEPTTATYRMHKGRSFSLCWDHGSSGHQRELPTQVSAAAAVMSVKPFDRCRCRCRCQSPPHATLIAAARRAAV